MSIIEIHSRPNYKTLRNKTKDWLITELLCMYEFCGKQTEKIQELTKDKKDV